MFAIELVAPLLIFLPRRPRRVACELPHGIARALNWIRPFRSINGYGLFRVMKTTRPEIVIEGDLPFCEGFRAALPDAGRYAQVSRSA